MDYFHSSAKIVSRSSGRSSVGAAAYRAGEKLKNEYDGVTHDYTRKTGIVYSEILLPDNAPKSFQDRGTLWNTVEKSERQCNSQTAREIEIALPKELNREEQIKFVQDYVKDNFVRRGMCADFSIHAGHKHSKDKSGVDTLHDKDIKADNPHAHILLTMRPLNQDGSFGAKSKKTYDINKNGERIKLPSGQWKSHKENMTDWDKRENITIWREDLANRINREMEKRGLPDRVDHRSFQEQGITDRRPQIHLGKSAHRLEQKGIKTERGNFNREVRADNMAIKNNVDELSRQLEEIRRQQEILNRQTAEAEKKAAEEKKKTEEERKEREREREKEEALNRSHDELLRPDRHEDISKKPQASKERDSTAPITQESADNIGKKMAQLKNDYMRGTQEIKEIQAQKNQLSREISKTQGDIQSIEKYKNNIDSNEKKTEQLQSERHKLGIFNGKEKKEIDGQISSIQKSKEQAEQGLKRDYGITKDQVAAKLNELQQKQRTLEQTAQKLPSTEQMKQQQEIGQKAELEYKKQKVMVDLMPEESKKEVANAENKYSKQLETTKGQEQGQKSVTGTMKKYEAEIKLQKISPAEYKKIKDQLPPQSKKMLEARDMQGGKNVPSYARTAQGTQTR